MSNPPKPSFNREHYEGRYKNISVDEIESLFNQHSGSSYWNSDYFHQYLDWYDQYLGKISQYKDTDYYERLKNNPYASYQNYQPGSIGEAIGTGLGVTGGAQNFYNSRMTSADEELNKILTEMQANTYNSPVAQAARDAQAGINDSLTGQTNGGEPFSAVGPDENNPLTGSQVTPESLGDIAGIASLPMNFIKGIASVVGAFQDVNLKDIAIGQGEIDLDAAARGEVLENATAGMSAADESTSFEEAVGNTLEAAVKSGTRKYRSMAARRAQNKAVGTIYYSNDGKPTIALREAYNKRMKNVSGDAKSIAENMSYPGYSSTNLLGFASQISEQVTQIQIGAAATAKKLSDIRLRLSLHGIQSEEKQQDVALAKANNELEYQNEFASQAGAQKQAQADVEGFSAQKIANEVAKSKAQFDKMIQESKTSIARTVYGEGGRLGKAGVILLPGIFGTIDTFSERFMNHFDSALDLILNPAGKVLGSGLAKALK